MERGGEYLCSLVLCPNAMLVPGVLWCQCDSMDVVRTQQDAGANHKFFLSRHCTHPCSATVTPPQRSLKKRGSFVISFAKSADEVGLMRSL